MVEEEETGRKIAQSVVFKGGDGMRIGGKLRQVRKWSDWKVEVRRVKNQGLSEAEWSYPSRPWMKGSGQPQAVRRYLGLAENQWPVVDGRDGTFVFHFGGARRRLIIELAAYIAERSSSIMQINEWFLKLPKGVGVKPFRQALETSILSFIPKLEHHLGRPYANQKLPMKVRVREVAQWLNIAVESSMIENAEWATVDGDVRKALGLFIPV